MTGSSQGASRRGRYVLVVEDEWLIADAVAHQLSGAGFEVVGPVPTLAKARRLLETSTIDAAVLDLRLADEATYPLAAELAGRSIPFLFLTGHNREDIDPAFRGRPCIGKPLADGALPPMLDELLRL
ncbi:response regulator [Hansschlegelia sp.]|uniref:response regulator n=1 Tax=Hansschlegelia sp. TaxID=2041892 RepID=UPI002B6F924D|nr:response regulator [Hansschlegelia sp.]HVI28590.1 response regulator [Hansschlegelia sp.]